MTTPKVLLLTLAFLTLSSSCFAENYMSYMIVKLGATAQFSYVQIVDALDGYLSIRSDVTSKVPYEIQTVSDVKVLIIN